MLFYAKICETEPVMDDKVINAHKEKLEARREYYKQYREKNAKRISEQHYAWYKANKDKVNAYRRNYEKQDHIRAKRRDEYKVRAERARSETSLPKSDE